MAHELCELLLQTIDELYAAAASPPAVEIVERTAGMILDCYAVGREPPVLPEDALTALRAQDDPMAQR